IQLYKSFFQLVLTNVFSDQRAIRGRPPWKNANPQGQDKLTQVVTSYVCRQGFDHQDVNGMSRIREFLRMNPPEFTRSKLNEDLENFMDEIQKVFKVMHVVDVERVELAPYYL
ncbi:hypothetical protein H5410_037104, partial [Solanum commersonii]